MGPGSRGRCALSASLELEVVTSDPYSALVSAVNFTSVTTDVVAVAALVVAVLVAVRAVRFIYSIVRR